jgi:hypothetical protein
MKSFGVLALAASASAYYVNGTVPMNGTVYTTEVVTAYVSSRMSLTRLLFLTKFFLID